MDAVTQSLFQELADEADELADDVENAYDEHAAFSLQLATRRKVEALSARYRAEYAKLDEKDRFLVDRGAGRRVSDLQKLAGRLPADPQGKPAAKPADMSFFGTRAPSSSRPPVNPGLAPGETPRDRSKIRVTDETEAWCGRCNMVRTQVVAAVVGDLPAQVVCQVCGTRSRYREGPARKKDGEAKTERKTAAPRTAAERAKDAKQVERNALVEELQAADSVRKYSPKERYKAGEIIEHPEHGRGKIENTLPRSLLVRFPSGLKPLKLG
jgi:hypothetical protein